MNIHEIFDGIRVADLAYDEDMLFDINKANAFRKEAAGREPDEDSIESIPLKRRKDAIVRHSVRNFDSERVVLLDDLAELLEGLRIVDKCDKYHEPYQYQYQYPSAGGLYPIDIYIYVKDKRVEGLRPGLYFYDRINHCIRLKKDVDFPITIHYYSNREIFKDSAFSIFFLYNSEFSYPKYGGMGLCYGLLDCGIIMEILEEKMRSLELGDCIIGDLNFDKIREHFEEKSIFLGAMEIGYEEVKDHELR